MIPAFAYEIAVIIQEGIKRMYMDQESIFYYLTVTNEPLPMPAMPEGNDVREGILKGIYRFRASTKKDAKLRAQLFGSGTIMYEVLKAQQILEEKYGVAADVWSVTSYKQLYRDGNDCERWNMLHPGASSTGAVCQPGAERCTRRAGGGIGLHEGAARIDRAVDASAAGGLGTDGFGRSESRVALRDFFEVDAKHIVLATLTALAREKQIKPDLLQQAVKDLGINPEKANPANTLRRHVGASVPLVLQRGRPSTSGTLAPTSSEQGE